MEIFGIINQSLVSVRKHHGDTSEMTNQLIYGDLVLLKSKINNWFLIESIHDKYEGWVDEKQLKQISLEEFEHLKASEKALTLSVLSLAKSSLNDQLHYLTTGSRLYQFKANAFNNLDEDQFLTGEIIENKAKPTGEDIAKKALGYLHSPYLWGGRSAWGIDCSGLVQMSFLLNGINLPRDAADQSQKGELIDFIHETQSGDLAFFDNNEGRIVHVGIVLPNNRIIHASGKVRIDTLDHQGIFQQDLKKYSHKLRVVKRML